MSRREYRSAITCAEDGCTDTRFIAHDTRADQAAAYQRQREHPYKCSRHANPERNLRPGNESTRQVLVASRLTNASGLYWVPEGAERGTGFERGPGFTAYASDFPEGTRLVVTTQVETPNARGRL